MIACPCSMLAHENRQAFLDRYPLLRRRMILMERGVGADGNGTAGMPFSASAGAAPSASPPAATAAAVTGHSKAQ